MSHYIVYSKFYDALEGIKEEKAEFIKNLIKTYSPDSKSILEIACGTGNMLQQMQEYKIAGLDNSKSMLGIAKTKLPGVELHEQDMRTFKLNQNFDVILCLYDSINHLITLEDWVKTFNSVSSHLNSEGLFIFDINTLFKLEKHVADGAYFKPFNNNYLVMQVLKDEIGYKWDIKVFEHKNASEYILQKDTIYENSFDIEVIKKSLGMFEILKICAPDGSDIKEDTGRVYFVCRKHA